jgi:predicted MPP superfamily phosphohydrolase
MHSFASPAHDLDERRGPHVVRHEVVVPGLDPAHDGLRIAHLTDLHVGMLTPAPKIRRAISRAARERPDLTVLTGDYLCYSPRFLPRLRELIAGIEGPAIAVLGNHDYWTDPDGVRRAFESLGISVLRNQHTVLRASGVPLEVVGIDDAITRHADPERAFRGTQRGRSRIVLTHAPNIADAAAHHGPSLTLAGHTHGGHVNIPRLTAAVVRRFGTRYLAGFYPVRGSLLYVNRGIGSSTVPVRAGAPPEVALLTLRAPRSI